MQLEKPKKRCIRTDIGKLPVGWESKQLKEIADLIVPMRDKPKKFDGDIPWIRIEDLDGKFVSGSKSNQKVSEETIKKMNLKPYPIGTVICSCSGNMGICAITKSILVSNQTFIGIVPHQKYYSDYLYYYLRFNKSKLENIGTGTTIHYIPREKFEQLKLPLPSSHEMQKIALILSKVDELIQKIDQIIEQTQRLKKGLMQKMFSDAGLVTHFKTLTIEEIKASVPNAISMGPFGSSIKTDNFVLSGIPVIRGVNLTKEPFNLDGFVFIKEGKADELRSANAFAGDIVFTHRGTLGQVGIIPDNTKYTRFVISQSQMKLTCDRNKAFPLYVYYFFKSPKGQNALLSNVSGTGVPAIGQPTTTLRKIRISLPPLLEQQKIASMLSKVDDLIQKKCNYKYCIQDLKKGLMQKILTGKIRVKV